MRLKIAVVLAHPDDETTMSGTLARYAAQGAEILLICATNGAGGASSSTLSPQELGVLRRDEMRSACDVLGIAHLEFLEAPDVVVHLSKGNYRDVLEEHTDRVAALLTSFLPDILVTFGPDGITGHPTHILVGQVARRACRLGVANPVIHQVVYREAQVHAILGWLANHPDAWQAYREEVAKTPNIGAPTPELFPVPDAVVAATVDVSSYRALRLEAARQHRSQGGLGYLEAYLAPEIECFSVLNQLGEPLVGRCGSELTVRGRPAANP